MTASTQRLLTRDVSLTYSGTYWSAVGRMTKYQLLQDINNPIQKPYDRVPQLTLSAARQDVGGFDLNFASEFARFSNTFTSGSSAGSEMVGGDRMYANQSVSYPIIRPGYFITPKASLDATTYRLNNVGVGAPTNLTRVVPTYSLDAGMTFERDTTLFGRDMTQTLEPRLFYVRTPIATRASIRISIPAWRISITRRFSAKTVLSAMTASAMRIRSPAPWCLVSSSKTASSGCAQRLVSVSILPTPR